MFRIGFLKAQESFNHNHQILRKVQFHINFIKEEKIKEIASTASSSKSEGGGDFEKVSSGYTPSDEQLKNCSKELCQRSGILQRKTSNSQKLSKDVIVWGSLKGKEM